MILEEKVKILEELWEHDHHTIELLAIYIPKLTGILIKYWGASGKHRSAVLGDLRGIRDAQQWLLDKEKERYASKRKPIDIYKLNTIYKGIGSGNENTE